MRTSRREAGRTAIVDATRDAAAPQPGPHNPVARHPPRAPGSIRRTTNVDISFPHGIGGPVTADVRGQDVRTAAAGDGEVIDAFGATFTIDPDTGQVAAVDDHHGRTARRDSWVCRCGAGSPAA